MPENPLISIIVPVWNGATCLPLLLEALTAQTVERALFEVIVVDNGSTDETAVIAGQFPGVILLSEPRPGSYRARNKAVARARGDYLLFTDADCVPEADWIAQAIVASREHPEAGVVAGRVAFIRARGGRASVARFEELTGFDQKRYVAAGHCITANWLCRKDVIEHVGGFNADLLSGGDFDCSRRIVQAGYCLVYRPEMMVRHPVRRTIGELIDKRRRVVGGRWKIDNFERKTLQQLCRTFAREGVRQLSSVTSSSLPLGQKIGVALVSVVLTGATMVEAARLRSGAAPHRS